MKTNQLILFIIFVFTFDVSAQLISKKEYQYLHESNISINLPPFSQKSDEVGYHYADSIKDTGNLLRDTLLYEGKVLLIYRSPLLFFENPEIVKKEESQYLAFPFGGRTSPTCQRLFTAVWEIRNGLLFLKHVTPYRDGEVEGIPWPSDKEVSERVENITGRKFGQEGLFANWVTGKISGGQGLYIGRGNKTYYVYPEEYLFEMKNGKILKVKTKTKK